MKKCTQCCKEKPSDTNNFYKRVSTRDTLASICKVCKNKNSKKWYELKGPEFSVWKGMKARCHNPNEIGYVDYGARGIKVCDEWINDYDAFIKHVGKRPSDIHSIDRIDNDKGYEPGNVKWSTPLEQSKNTRVYKNSKTGYPGVNWHGENKVWLARINSSNVRYNLGSFKNIEDAIAARKAGELKYWNKHS